MALLAPDEKFTAEPLSGGVSCDVWRIDRARGDTFVLKRALPKLRVEADWRAPAARSHTEVEWLKLVAGIDSVWVPEVIGEDRSRHMFAMAYLPPETHPVWKAQLANGHADAEFAARVGTALVRIHAATAGQHEIASAFATQAQFHALRLEPYLLHTAERHPDLADWIRSLVDGIGSARIALMQGDVSPKNILCGPQGPVFLDAETAAFGDPAFDLAFCLNHLLLKCVWHPEFSERYLHCFAALEKAYLGSITWEAPLGVDERTAALLPALLLARIDGKSPVEYLHQSRDRDFVRAFARQHLVNAPASLEAIRSAWRAAVRNL